MNRSNEDDQNIKNGSTNSKWDKIKNISYVPSMTDMAKKKITDSINRSIGDDASGYLKWEKEKWETYFGKNSKSEEFCFSKLGLKPSVFERITRLEGIRIPTKIQRDVIFQITKNKKDVIAQSMTGTGKTLAFLISAFELIDEKINKPQVICISPTRELSLQTYEISNSFLKKEGESVKVKHLVNLNEAINQNSIDSHILICNQGKFVQYKKNNLIDINYLKLIVIDEADLLLLAEISITLVDFIFKARQKNNNLIVAMLSATFGEEVKSLAKIITNDAKFFSDANLDYHQPVYPDVKVYYKICNGDPEKGHFILDLYNSFYCGKMGESIGQSIIFVNYRISSQIIGDFLKSLNYSVGFINANIGNDEREAVMKAFREGKFNVIIATNVLARGIDIPNVSTIINYHLPMDREKKVDIEAFVHRLGRTGRFGRRGICLNLIMKSEIELIKRLEKLLGLKIENIEDCSNEVSKRDIENFIALKNS